MLTKHQEQDLEKAVLGYLVSRKYYQTVSSFVQESESMRAADFISLSDPSSDPGTPSQINLVFNISKDDSDFALSKNSALSNLSVESLPLSKSPVVLALL
jgi:hypothetical protein